MTLEEYLTKNDKEFLIERFFELVSNINQLELIIDDVKNLQGELFKQSLPTELREGLVFSRPLFERSDDLNRHIKGFFFISRQIIDDYIFIIHKLGNLIQGEGCVEIGRKFDNFVLGLNSNNYASLNEKLHEYLRHHLKYFIEIRCIRNAIKTNGNIENSLEVTSGKEHIHVKYLLNLKGVNEQIISILNIGTDTKEPIIDIEDIQYYLDARWKLFVSIYNILSECLLGKD